MNLNPKSTPSNELNKELLFDWLLCDFAASNEKLNSDSAARLFVMIYLSVWG